MTHLMEGVIDRGTGAAVRSRGFKLPAAGKTGTSRDGWFAGYTTDLLVIAWVGFDDNRDLGLEGSRSALPIWADFMRNAYALYPPRNRMSFKAPPGIEIVRIDAESLMRATPDCTNTFEEAFIQGTAPSAYCPLHSPQIANEVAAPPDTKAPAEIIRAKPSSIEQSVSESHNW
jgi:penicillin-binding protein 1B